MSQANRKSTSQRCADKAHTANTVDPIYTAIELHWTAWLWMFGAIRERAKLEKRHNFKSSVEHMGELFMVPKAVKHWARAQAENIKRNTGGKVMRAALRLLRATERRLLDELQQQAEKA